MYVIGGETSWGGPQKTTFKISLKTQKVSIRAYMHVIRTAMGVCNIGHYIYAIGGFKELTSCEVYNTLKNRWTMLKYDLPMTKDCATAVPIKKRFIYLFDGKIPQN